MPEAADTAFLEEHVLGTAQTDAFCAQLPGLLGITGRVGVGADLQTAVLVSPSHDAAELAGDLSVLGLDDAIIDAAGGAIQRQLVAFVEDLAGQGELLVLLIVISVCFLRTYHTSKFI